MTTTTLRGGGVLSVYAQLVGEIEPCDDVTHQVLLRKRGHPMSFEHMPPIGQAALWYGDVINYVPRSGQAVAQQLARLCGSDSSVTLPWRSLADAVGRRDKANRVRAYTERGVQVLTDNGWLKVETTGRGRGSRTTFLLMPGDLEHYGWAYPMDEADDLDDAA
jgi:hypothetical protein